MTRAEAIKWFEDYTAVLDIPYTPCPGNESSAVAVEDWAKVTNRYRELYGMAISALKEQEEMVRTIARLQSQLSDAENCIWAIEDALDRGTDNDWAREAIKTFEQSLKEGANDDR